MLPNDDTEQERLDLQHHIWRLMLDGRLHTAPLPKPEENPELRILDLGCGTGIWAIDIADEYPSAEVFGVDLSPIQPDWVPNNCRFHVDDYEDEWTYAEDEKFDYIHARAISGTSADWNRFYQRVKRNLKPGGWVELQEYDTWIFSDDDSFDRAPWTKDWVQKLDDASKAYGKQMNVAKEHRRWMGEAGFENVREATYRVSLLELGSKAVECKRSETNSHRFPSGRGPRTLCSRKSESLSSSTCKCQSTRTQTPSSLACTTTRLSRCAS